MTTNVNWRRTAALLLPWEVAGMGRLFGGERLFTIPNYNKFDLMCSVMLSFFCDQTPIRTVLVVFVTMFKCYKDDSSH